MTQLALKVDVDTLRGTLEGAPALASLLAARGIPATFLFSLGPDNTGRALRRIFRRGFLRKVLRTSVGANYGLRTLTYGLLWPGPNIARRARDAMRRVRDAGFEVGVHCHDHVLWQDFVARRDRDWARSQMRLARAAFLDVFEEAPRVHGAAGWQMNEFVPELEAELGFTVASDTRGRAPFLPANTSGAAVCPQWPTTLPTFDELIGLDGCTESNVAERVAALTPTASPHQVFTLHAELEGMRLAGSFASLLTQWTRQGVEFRTLGALAAAIPAGSLPRHHILAGEVPGRSGTLACQAD